MLAAQAAARPTSGQLDPSWPPVLVVFVVVVLGAVVVALVVVMRALRADGRRDGGTG